MTSVAVADGAEQVTIREATAEDFDSILSVINDAAVAYKGVIPADAWVAPAPYMSVDELRCDIDVAGISFYVAQMGPGIVGVMGIQKRKMDEEAGPSVTLIRHAYTRTAMQKKGIGTALMAKLQDLAANDSWPVLVGTWTASQWAIRFYEKRGFRAVEDLSVKNNLLRRYWFCEDLGALNNPTSEHRRIQMAASVVLVDNKWLDETLTFVSGNVRQYPAVLVSSKALGAELQELWHGYRRKNDEHMREHGVPLETAFYNMACLHSLAIELELRVLDEECEYCDEPEGYCKLLTQYGDVIISGKQNLVAPNLPPATSDSGADDEFTVRTVVNERLDACTTWLQLAVTSGFARGETTGPALKEHLRVGDVDLRAVRELRGFSWMA